jgi:protein gp37
MSKTTIEWTDTTWNPTTGCDKISAGCKNCYAAVMSKRLMAMGQHKYRNNFELAVHEEELTRPYGWKKPRKVFVNSMSDLFHKDVPLEFIKKVFKVMNDTPHHTYQVLTKRAQRLEELASELIWTPNIWMGVSIENEQLLFRLDHLRNTPARVKFVSAEPLIGPLPNMDLNGIHQVIVGGESGPKSRPIEKSWVVDIKNQCEFHSTSFFFKQWGGVHKKDAGRLLDGLEYNEYPVVENPSPIKLNSQLVKLW